MALTLSRRIQVTTTTNLDNKISRRAIEIMTNRINTAKKATTEKLKELITDAIKNSPVYRAIAGANAGYTNGDDLQAEFGIRNEQVFAALTSMMKILIDTIDITYSAEYAGKSRLVIKVKALDPEEYEDKLKHGEEFSYESYGNYIPWMEWLLEASQSIIDETLGNDEYGITYDLNSIEAKISRSHRAKMVRNTSRVRPFINRHVNFPYKFPKIALPSVANSKNWLEDISKNRRFKSMITNEIEKLIKKILKPRSR